MILTDAGPLVALLDRGEAQHHRCVLALASLSLPMVTTWPAFAEAMYLLGDGGWRAQQQLWTLVQRQELELADSGREGLERAHTLMEQYQDIPMDLADATLVALAEWAGHRRIFTLDSHFLAYRVHGRQPLEIVPESMSLADRA